MVRTGRTRFRQSSWVFFGTDEGLGSSTLLEFSKRTCNFASATSMLSLYSENRKKKQVSRYNSVIQKLVIKSRFRTKFT